MLPAVPRIWARAGDTVEVDAEGRLITALHQQSGNRIFRGFIPVDVPNEDFMHAYKRLLAAIDRSDVSAEWNGDREVSVYVPEGDPYAISQVWIAVQEIGVGKTIHWEWADVHPFQPSM